MLKRATRDTQRATIHEPDIFQVIIEPGQFDSVLKKQRDLD